MDKKKERFKPRNYYIFLTMRNYKTNVTLKNPLTKKKALIFINEQVHTYTYYYRLLNESTSKKINSETFFL